ncbi:MAG: hypothetical protein WA051_00180 [Minisyncoccia bacterium]
MLCYRFQFAAKADDKPVVGKVLRGIPVEHGEVTLGEYLRKRGDTPPRIIVNHAKPPELLDGFVISASIGEGSDGSLASLVRTLGDTEGVLLLASSHNPDGVVPLNGRNSSGSFFRHVPIRKSGGVKTLLKGLSTQQIQGHRFEIETVLVHMKPGSSIIVKPAGAHNDDAWYVAHRHGEFEVRRLGDRIGNGAVTPIELHVPQIGSEELYV